MDVPPLAVTGAADRVLATALREIAPLLDELHPGVLVIGGLMTRIWVHATPDTVPVRPTADIDLGIDRAALSLHGDRRRVDPALRALGFEPGYGNEPFRYAKLVDGVGEVIVDVLVAPGASRADPPVVEAGLESLAAPGLAYAILRGPIDTEVQFVDDDRCDAFNLPIPTADSAFVLKAALIEKGLRRRPDRLRTDTVDALSMASVCLGHPDAISALDEHRGRSDVRASLRWLADAFRSPKAIGSRRLEDHYVDEGVGPGMGAWSATVAARFLDLTDGAATRVRPPR